MHIHLINKVLCVCVCVCVTLIVEQIVKDVKSINVNKILLFLREVQRKIIETQMQ